MKILVVDDKVIHRESAAETLPNHELTIVSSFDEAMDLLFEIQDICKIPLQFEAVLTDMLMPMSRSTLAQGIYRHGELVSYGFIIALKAAMRGAKYVAMVTDVNHHYSAISAALDYLGSAYYSGREDVFYINGAKVKFVHAPFVKPENDEKKEWRKDWGRVLADLLK